MATSDPDCPFCEIIAREDPDAREVYRDQYVVAFFPSEPATLGHTLLVPREHVPDIWTLSPDIAGRLGRATVELALAVRRAMNPEGLNIIQSNGQAASQTVMHLHIHIVPRRTGDALGRIWPPETHYSEEQKDAAWERLKEEASHLKDRSDDQVVDPEDRRKHLDFIQAVVTRMSASSAITKGWLLPVVTAAYGYALTVGGDAIAVLGMAAVALFGIVDANYLNQERAFRRLYDSVARGDKIVPFSLDHSLAAPAGMESGGSQRGMWASIRDWIPPLAVWSSWAIAPLYGSLLIVGAIILIVR